MKREDLGLNTFFERVYACEEVHNDEPGHEEFVKALERAKKLCMEYNEPKVRTDEELRNILEKILLSEVDEMTVVNPPFRCDLGFNVHLGKNVMINCNCFFLDSNTVSIGDYVMIGPNVTIVTPNHSKDPEGRRRLGTVSEPVIIEDDAWIGAGAIILPGVTVGRGSVVGAGSVVTKNVPPGVAVAGNPAKIIRGE